MTPPDPLPRVRRVVTAIDGDGVDADRAHAESRPVARRERQKRQHTASVDPLLAATHADLGLEVPGEGHELTRRASVQAQLALNHELGFVLDDFAHRSSSGSIALATEMLRWP